MSDKRAAALLLILFTLTCLLCQSCAKTEKEAPQVYLLPDSQKKGGSAEASTIEKDSVQVASKPKSKPVSSRDGDWKKGNPYWARAKEIVYGRSGRNSAAQQRRFNRSELEQATLDYGKYNVKEIALTFDDGPHRKYTPQILKVLKRYNVRATFFIVGKMADASDDLLVEQYREGHQIGNHTYHHVDMTKLSEKEAQVEWVACNEVVKSILRISPRYCRPPGGNYDDTVKRAALKSGLVTVLWTEDPGDYDEPGGFAIESRIFCSIYNGGIILLHDGVQQTINILPSIIERLKREGYTFVTVDEMYRKRKK